MLYRPVVTTRTRVSVLEDDAHNEVFAHGNTETMCEFLLENKSAEVYLRSPQTDDVRKVYKDFKIADYGIYDGRILVEWEEGRELAVLMMTNDASVYRSSIGMAKSDKYIPEKATLR